ncbi:ubiquitin carboxyl-terminal hydrolase [Microdochium trichocladiopsis]|uniref:Ubiquitin carboxyl-terminal hydrolase n=1 Tax=Microdochium trichocladiopsis TaxID=1682393 RepID=A0A9P9BPM2_9PEZI|nr:ubiquitin carboxyl-terminal hydrolase [Microdochium trichocladiopsis]KAH7029409.1 ubiquitin carboxyl-terminal hydrolase [Microdochium trichocladiopsis]
MALSNNPAALATPLHSPKLSAEPSTDTVRRSSRTKKSVKKFEDEDFVVAATPSKSASRQSAPTNRASRPKRKAAVAAEEINVTEDSMVLLDQVVTHMHPDERTEYKGWVELESEPAFFNAMLHLLGAEDFKVQELFGLDELALELLLKPVHGLIYLYQYIEGATASDNREDCPAHLWFGNQTTTNACATVALMNIVMNAEEAVLGKELQSFKDMTLSLPPPHRGHMLDKNDFIRSIHNSVARRMDLVSEDLILDNKMEAAEKKRCVQSRKKPTRPGRIQKRANTEQAFHYIAYVPVDGQVWELDGFEVQPRCLGSFSSKDEWLGVASNSIQQRMMADEYLQCSLLAVCQSPVRRIVEQLDACTEKLRGVGHSMSTVPANLTGDATDLAATTPITTSPGRPPARVIQQSPTLADPEHLKSQQTMLMAEYTAELAAREEGTELLRARQQDYTPAVHRWVRLLAEKGALRELITEAAGGD